MTSIESLSESLSKSLSFQLTSRLLVNDPSYTQAYKLLRSLLGTRWTIKTTKIRLQGESRSTLSLVVSIFVSSVQFTFTCQLNDHSFNQNIEILFRTCFQLPTSSLAWRHVLYCSSCAEILTLLEMSVSLIINDWQLALSRHLLGQTWSRSFAVVSLLRLRCERAIDWF